MRVNVERAVAAQDLMEDIVSGHVDGQLILLRHGLIGGTTVCFRHSGVMLDLLVEKGGVAINGVSLTVNSIASDVLSVMCSTR